MQQPMMMQGGMVMQPMPQQSSSQDQVRKPLFHSGLAAF